MGNGRGVRCLREMLETLSGPISYVPRWTVRLGDGIPLAVPSSTNPLPAPFSHIAPVRINSHGATCGR